MRRWLRRNNRILVIPLMWVIAFDVWPSDDMRWTLIGWLRVLTAFVIVNIAADIHHRQCQIEGS